MFFDFDRQSKLLRAYVVVCTGTNKYGKKFYERRVWKLIYDVRDEKDLLFRFGSLSRSGIKVLYWYPLHKRSFIYHWVPGIQYQK